MKLKHVIYILEDIAIIVACSPGEYGQNCQFNAVIIGTMMSFVIISLEMVANVRMVFRMLNAMNVSYVLIQIIRIFTCCFRDILVVKKNVDIHS